MELTAEGKQLYEEAQGILAAEAMDETVPAQRRRHTNVRSQAAQTSSSRRPSTASGPPADFG